MQTIEVRLEMNFDHSADVPSNLECTYFFELDGGPHIVTLPIELTTDTYDQEKLYALAESRFGQYIHDHLGRDDVAFSFMVPAST